MAQVKKFNTGGSVQKMKYGNIIKNGTTYEMTEESMKRLEQHIAAADPDVQQSLANDWKLLMSGQDVVIDTMANRRSTVPTDFTKGQLRRLDKDKPTESKWHGAVNSDIHKYNLATQYFGTFDPSKIETKEETPKIKLMPGSSKFEYRIDENGVKSYKSLPNTDEMKLFDSVAAYLVGDDAYRAGYDVSGWAGFNDIDTWYKNLNNSNFIKDLRVKILNGSDLTPDEEDYLAAIGLGSDAITAQREQEVDSELKTKQNKAWEAFNVGNLWDSSLRDKQIVYDPNTDAYRIDSQYMPSNLPKDTQGWYFNDDFLRMYSGYGYDWLDGKVNFNKQWYSEADLYNPASQLYQMLNNPNNDYYNKNRRGDYAGADAILKTDWDGVYHIPVMTEATADRMGDMYQNPNLRYIEMDYNRPGATYRGNALDKTYNIWRYQDFSDEEGMDGLGRRQERWTITDAYGNPVFLDGNVTINKIPTYNFNDFKGLYTGSSDEANQKITYTNRVSSDPNNKEYYNRYADTPLTDANGNNIIEGWIDPTTKKVHVAINKAWGGTEDTVFTNMPMDVYSAIKDLNFVNKLNSLNNRVLLKEFKKLIQGKKSDITENNLISLGISSETAQHVIDYFKGYWNSNPVPTNRPKMKNGGTLYLQHGGPIKHVGSEKFVSDKVNQLATRMQNPTASKVVFDGNGLTDTDWWELAALITDLVSFGAGLLPGWGDAANLIGGQAANWTRFAIDKQRKKEGLDAHPWRNYLASTGADVLSVIPILGDAVNLGDFGRKAIPFFKRTYGAITTGLAGLGLYGAKDAIDKLLSGEDLTIEDVQALSTGLQSLTGLGMKAGMKIGDANLAVKTQPKQQIKHEFKFKDGETDVTKVLDAEDIKVLTDAKGRNNINAALTKILKSKGVPEDQIPEMVKSFNYKDSGLNLHEYGKLGKDRITVIEPEKEHDFGYYLARPKKRQEVLNNAKAVDVASAGNPRAAARWFWRTEQKLPEGYELIGKNYPMHTRVVNKTKLADEIVPSDVVTTSKPKSIETSPHPTDPDFRVVETNQHFSSDEFDQKFAQYQAFIRGNNSSSTKKFKERFEKYAQTEDFKKLAEDDPELVRLMIDEEISNVLGKSKRSENAEASLRKDLDRIKTKYDLKFKKGGILKGSAGIPLWKQTQELLSQGKIKFDIPKPSTALSKSSSESNTASNPFKRDYRIDKDPFKPAIPKPSPILSNLIQPAKVTSQLKQMPSIQTKAVQQNPTGVPEQSPVKRLEQTLETKANTKPLEIPTHGQHPHETETEKGGWLGEASLAAMGLGEYLHKQLLNNRIADKKIKGLRDATILGMKSAPAFVSTPRYNNAFAPYKNAAEQMTQYTPPVNSDYSKMAAFEYGKMKDINNTLLQGHIAASEKQDQINNSVAQAQRQRALEIAEVENYNRDRWAQYAAGKSSIETTKDLTSGTNFGNLLREYRTELDQSAAQMDNINAAKNELIAEKSAEDQYRLKLKERFGAAYKADPNKGSLTIEQWVNAKPEYATEAALLREQLRHTAKLDALTRSANQVKYGNLFAKSGGKLRSTSDQIKINKHKAFDKIWVDNNKAALKAIEHLNKQTYQILMKLLS